MEFLNYHHLLGESGVTFCAERKLALRLRRQLPGSLHLEPMLLPTSGTALRRTLEKWFQEQDIHPRVVAEYDDAARMKVAAADGLGCFPLPTVAVNEAVTRYGFQIVGQAKGCAVQFYAIGISISILGGKGYLSFCPLCFELPSAFP